MADRHVRFTLPDPVAVTQQRETAPGVWMSHIDAKSSVMMQVPEVGAFVRSLLPVKLDTGETVTFGVWLCVPPDDLQLLTELWDRPGYLSMIVNGVLANAIPPWGLLAVPVRAVVRNRQHTPYCESSPDEQLTRVLTEVWPAEDVNRAIAQSGA